MDTQETKSESRYQKFIYLTDLHSGYERKNGHKVPLHDAKAAQVALQFAKEFKPDVVILGGDILDCGAVSHHNKHKPGRTEGMRILQDAEDCRENFIAKVDQLGATKKVYIIGNHECLDPKTRLLTPSGFKYRNELTVGDAVYTYNRETGLGEFQPIRSFVDKAFTGTLLNFTARGTDICVTPQHNMLRRVRTNGKTELIPADQLPTDWQLITAADNNKHDLDGVTDELIQIAGWFITDGGYSGRYPKFYQRESRHKEITDLLDKASIKYTVYNRGKRNTNFKANENQMVINIAAESLPVFTDLLPTKAIQPWMWQLSSRQLKLFIQAAIRGDGTIPTGAVKSKVLYCKGASQAEELMALCVLAGYRVSLTEYRPTHFRLNIVNTKTIRQTTPPTEVQYNGNVWCVNVENGTILVERNGKIAFTGNCWLEDFEEDYPVLEGMLNVKTLLKLDDQWEVIPQGGHYNLGKLTFIHGDTVTGGEHVAKSAVVNYERSIRFGHHHTYQVYTKCTPIDNKLGKTGIAVPCLCSKSPKYGESKPNRWVQGFNYGYVAKDGTYHDNVAIITNGRSIIEGKLYDADKDR